MRNLSSNRPFTRNVRAITVVAGSVMALATGGVLFASTASAADDPMVTLCHSTGSDSNPYVTITVAAAGAASGHYPNNTEASGNDIIPAFTYNGQNFDAKGDQRILNNGCVVPTTITTTTAAPTTTTAAPTTTTQAPTTTTQAPTTTTQAPATSSGSTGSSNGGGSGLSASGAGVSSNGGGSGPIPTGVDSGQHTVSSWELPLGGALSAVGAAGLAGSALRKRQSR